MSINTITKHYIDGGFVESHGREVMDRPASDIVHIIACMMMKLQ